jgi:hypothetical protein
MNTTKTKVTKTQQFYVLQLRDNCVQKLLCFNDKKKALTKLVKMVNEVGYQKYSIEDFLECNDYYFFNHEAIQSKICWGIVD